MKKMTKLLSVILAFVMALSCMTMMASAAKEQYQTVANLTAKNAYSPYGTVTRLDTETRMSIVFDFLDNTLAPLNITMSQKLSVLGTLNVDLRSVNGICSTVDSLDSLMNSGFSGFLVAIAGWALGDLRNLELTKWTNNMTREKTANLTIAYQILKLLSDNKSLINTALTNGLSLGLVGNFIPLDMNSVNGLLKNIPGALKGIVYPMFGRPDDTQAERDNYSNTDKDIIALANAFAKGIFTKPMSWTSYRVDASGKDLGYTLKLPTTNDSSRYFVINGDKITQYDYQYAGLLGNPKGGEWVETVTYEKAKEFNTDECTTYVYRAPEGYEGDETLKWY
ncbi:MAG: hypothetical protein J1F37_04250, partial [Oscillospiraceae bacterium]|nr:hypothetical protein [Oscillospiraceae bacterium]